MFQSKSFNLATEKFKFSQLRWAKFLVLPGLLAFVLLLILSNLKPNDYYEEPMNNTNIRSATPSMQCEYNDTCSIRCSGEIINLQAYLASVKSCETIELSLFNCVFPEKKIPTNWLTGKFEFKIRKLGIYQCAMLNEIDPRAFSANVFVELKEIIFWKVSINKMYSDTFYGLPGIRTLSFTINYNENFSYDMNYLQPISETLEKFTFEISSLPKAINPKSLIGTRSLERLLILDISNNNYNNLIESNTFDILPRITQLYLQNSYITALEPHVFDCISESVQLIDLRNNRIINLPNGFFNKLLPTQPQHSVILQFMLESNRLDCSCDSSYLFNMIKENPRVFRGHLICVGPTVVAGSLLSLLDECVEPQMIPPECLSAVFPSNQSTPPNSSADPFKIKCGNEIENEYVEIDQADVNFTIVPVTASSVKVKMSGSSKDYAVLWFNNATTNVALMEMNYKDYGLGCRSKFEGELIVGDLKTGVGYTFCLIKGRRISPFNCHSLFIDKKTAERDNWFYCESQSFIISMFSIGIMLAVILGAFSMFCLIRWKPTIVKSSKRVVVINKNSSDVMILPRNSSSSFESTTNNTAVSTKSFSFRKKTLRRMSDISIESGRSYMVPGNTYEVVQYQRQSTIDQGKTYFESAPKETPPPLPKRLSVQSTLPKDEMFCISQEYHKYHTSF